jgi:sugar lactone lactonase YvrE/peroxiredoxin
MKKFRGIAVVLIAVCLCLFLGPIPSTAEEQPDAPELDGALAWLNTEKPLRMEELRGNVVLLDFWTYCCINCMHVLPTLRQIEKDFADEPFVVIGVHSAKFQEEKEAANIREAIERHDIRHPVAVDSNFTIWRNYGVNAWPTLFLIGADGKAMAKIPGEPKYEDLKKMISLLLAEAKQKGIANSQPPRLNKNPNNGHKDPFLYPGKVLPLNDGTLLVADSAHHRLVQMKDDGEVVDVIGSGLDGFRDGTFTESAFSRPQGMVEMAPGVLWVADTDNHSIRRVDLRKREVTTLFGNGQKGQRFHQVSDGWKPGGDSVDFRSPWALEKIPGGVAVAMAGSHQLFLLNDKGTQFRVLAGSGRERLTDGAPADAAFAQPSGLALSTDKKWLYLADSETSAIRRMRISDGQTETLVGTGLFDFGDRNGPLDTALLQHPLAIEVLDDGTLIVADTFNSKLKRLDVKASQLSSFALAGKAKRLKEPGGIARRGDTLYVADTNQHRVLAIDLKTGKSQEIKPKDLGPPALHGGILDRSR